MMKATQIWLVVCAAVIAVHTGVARDLYVSHKGHDTQICGPASQACKTVQYAIDKSSKDDVIHLLSDSVPYYTQSVIGQPTNVTHTLHIRSTPSAKLTCRNASTLFRVFKPEVEGDGTVDNVTLNLENISILNCGMKQDSLKRGVIEVANASVNVKNCKFSSNPVVIHHSQLAQDACSYVKVVISGSHFTANGIIKPLQAAINIAGCDSASVVIKNTTFNWSPISLEANQNLNVDISGSEMDGRTLRAGSFDVTLASRKNNVVLTDCFFRNHNNSRGSAVTIGINQKTQSDPVVHLNRVTFSNNDQSQTIGAALSLISRLSYNIVPINAKLNECKFVNNTALRRGGAVYIQGVERVNINNCTFSNNKALEGGALLMIESQDILIQNCTFIGNKATHRSDRSSGQGGAILGFKSGIKLDKNVFANNTAPIYGQALHLMEVTMAIIQYSNFSNSLDIFEESSLPKMEVYMSQTESVYAPKPRLVMKNSRVQLTQCRDHSGVVHLESKGGLEHDHNVVCCPAGQQLQQLVQKTSPLCSSDHGVSLQQAWCSACSPGTYSPQVQCENVGSCHSKPRVTCRQCPAYAICPGSGVLRPVDNYWGRSFEDTVSFHLCPRGFCYKENCTGLECCSSRRMGRLCGTCGDNELLDISTNRCVSEKDCKYHQRFLYGYAVAFSTIYTCILLVVALVCEHVDYQIEVTKVVGLPSEEQTEHLPSDNTSDTSSFEPSINYTRSVDSHGLVAVTTDTSQTSQGLGVSASKATKSIPCNLPKEAPFVICAWIMFIQLTQIMYSPWYGTLDQRHTIIGAMHDVIHLQPLFIFLDTPCGDSSFTSLSKPVLHLVSVLCMYASVMILHRASDTIMLITEKARGRDLSSHRKFLNVSVCRALLLIFTLTYVSSLKALFSLIHCVGNINNAGFVLYLNGELSCHVWWHWLAVVLLIVIFAPVGVAVWLGLQLVKSDTIRAPTFLLGILLPLPTALYWEIRYGKHVCRCLRPHLYLYARMQLQSVELIPNTSRNELTVTRFFHWPAPALPLKDSTDDGISTTGEDGTSAWIIYIFMRAFILVTFAVLLSHDPVTKSIVLVACLLLAMTLQVTVRPYKVLLANHVEWMFLAILLLLSVLDLHNSVLYVTGWKPYENLTSVAEAFDWLYVVFFGLSLLMLCLIVLVHTMKSCCKLL